MIYILLCAFLGNVIDLLNFGFKSSGMWRCVILWVAADVSEDSGVFNFKAEAV